MQTENPTLEQVYSDLSQRSLSKLPGDLARFIYLASTRDYNTGDYHHEGLAFRYRADLACAALELAHRHLFLQLAALPLEQLVNEVQHYLQSAAQPPEELLQLWQKLEPYRVALPLDVNAALAQLFVSNLRVSLAIVQHHFRKAAERTASSRRR
jgi:hypothetical protein